MPKASAKPVFSIRLKEARKAAGLTQERLGELAGIDIAVARTRINRYELGLHQPDPETAKRLAKTLNVPLASLYADSEAMARLIKAAADLPDAELSKLADELAARVGASGTKRKKKAP